MSWSKKQYSIIGIVAITSFMGTFLISSVNIALPAIEKDLKLNAVRLSWVVTSFLLTTAIFLLPAGRFGDLYGIRRLFKTGLAIFVLSSLSSGLAPSGAWLIGFRLVQGAGAALSSATGPAILVAAFPPKQRGRVLGISVAAVYIGLATGPFAGGLLTQYLGWRSLFFVATVLGLLAALVAWVYLGSDPAKETKQPRPQLLGTLFYLSGLIGLTFGSSRIPDPAGWGMMLAGVLALALFWRLESRSPYPVIATSLFTKNRLFAFSNLAALINYSATFAIVFLLSLYLQKIKGLNPGDAGMILIAQPLMMALFSPLAGKWSDRIQPAKLATLGMSICTLGLFALSFAGAATPVWMFIAILIWVGLGFALFSSPNMNTIMGSVDKQYLGLASGTAATMRVVGQIVSMTLATLFISALIGDMTIQAAPEKDFLMLIRWGFLSFGTLSISGIYFSWNRGKLAR